MSISKWSKAHTGRVLIESHRADHDSAEDTWTALHSAREAGADLIEVDVQTTADDMFVVRHNYTLPDGRWTNDVTWAEVQLNENRTRALVALPDVLSWAQAGQVPLVLDVKSGFRDPYVVHHALASEIVKFGVLDHVVVADWDHLALARSRTEVPGLMIRAAIGARLANFRETLEVLAPDIVGLPWDLVRPEDVAVAHSVGVAVSLIKGWHPKYFEVAKACDVDLVSWNDVNEARRLMNAS